MFHTLIISYQQIISNVNGPAFNGRPISGIQLMDYPTGLLLSTSGLLMVEVT